MPWRLHLTNRAIQRLDVLPALQQSVLAVWTQPGRLAYFDWQTGAALGEKRWSETGDGTQEHWDELLQELKAPNGRYPPVVLSAGAAIYLNQAGQQRLVHQRTGRLFYMTAQGRLPLAPDVRFLAVGLNAAGTRAAALDDSGRLHVFLQGVSAGVHTLDLQPPGFEIYRAVAVTEHSLYVAWDRVLVALDSEGRVRKRLQLHYPLGAFACAPGGRLLVCSDRETNVIRVYDEHLTPLYQRHAADLMARAAPLQLIADPPPSMIVLHTLAVDDAGRVAFALAGVICVTDVEQMLALPRPVV